MGDRAQVKINMGTDPAVWLYTHWDGSELVGTVKKAMRRKQRWNDAEYLARIIFCEMVSDQEAGETGFGISTSEHGDLNYPVIEVDCATQRVVIDGDSFTFNDFIA